MWGWILGLFKKRKPMILGVDVSHYQSDKSSIRWAEVAKDPQEISYAFIKATEGQTYVDSDLIYNATEAKKAGLWVGYYHFATLNTQNIMEDAKAEARFFVKTILSCPTPDLPLVLDIEKNKANLSPQQIEVWIKIFFKELEILGHNNYMIYSYTPFLNANLPNNHKFGEIKLWLAAYVTQPQPRLPVGWSEYQIWQFSATGRVRGIVGDVDMNRFKT